jgi:hypothetical protein
MAQNNGDFTAKVSRAVTKYLFFIGNSAKVIYDGMVLGRMRPSDSKIKNWVARFRTGYLSTENEEGSWRPTQVKTSENLDAIHSMILDD